MELFILRGLGIPYVSPATNQLFLMQEANVSLIIWSLKIAEPETFHFKIKTIQIFRTKAFHL
jgi:hypothetical protein